MNGGGCAAIVRGVKTGACWTIAAAASLLAARAWAGDPYGRLAEAVGAAARAGGVATVAVVPFRAAGGEDRAGGLALSERLVGRLLQGGTVDVVERTRLEAVLAEQRLGADGVVDPRRAAALGKVLGADAVITGTYVTLSGGRVEVHARLIDVESSRVLGAASARVVKEWEETLMPVSALWDVKPPREEDFPAPLVRLVPDPFRDALNDSPCAGWEAEAARLGSETLHLKARFWAGRLRDPGFNPRSVTRNPGSEIRSVELRREFYALVRSYYDGGTPRLSPAERDTLTSAESAVAALVERCE